MVSGTTPVLWKIKKSEEECKDGSPKALLDSVVVMVTMKKKRKTGGERQEEDTPPHSLTLPNLGTSPLPDPDSPSYHLSRDSTFLSRKVIWCEGGYLLLFADGQLDRLE